MWGNFTGVGYCIIMACGKVSTGDKMRIQTLRERGLWVKAISGSYSDKNWNLGPWARCVNV